MEDIKSMDLESKDLVADRIALLKELFPEITTEGDGSIDFEKLRLILGDEVNEDDERYVFTWPGKANAIRQAQTSSTATLRPCPEKSVNWNTTDNLYIEGDNLEVLKLLQRGYHGKVKMIYIDPPYNTGHDFVYCDSFAGDIENYKEQAGIAGQSNADTSGRYHSNWCSMMYPRLKLARELLSDDGVVFISIDENENRNLRILCDEIFGEKNFVAQICCLCNPKGRSQDKYIATCHEYLLCYSKMILSSGAVSIPKSKMEIESDYPLVDPNYGPYRELELRNTHRDFGRNNRPNLFYPFYVDTSSGKISLDQLDGTVEVLPIWNDGYEGCWTWGKAKSLCQLDDLVAKKINGEWKIFRKAFAFTEGSAVLKQVKSIWTEKEFFTEKGQKEFNQLFSSKGKIFQSPKSVEMIKQVIKMGAFKDSVILDFFSGSATFAQAAVELNALDNGQRKFICVQLPEVVMPQSDAALAGYSTICEIGEERIRRAGEKIAKEVEESNRQLKLGEEPKKVPDIGFRVLKLDESGIARPEPGQLVLDRVKPDRTDEDIIFEMMLKWGLELTYSIEKIGIAGYPCYSVAGDALICCMQEGLTVEAIQAIANRLPNRVFMLDSILDDTLKLNAVQIFKHAEEKNQVTIDLRTV